MEHKETSQPVKVTSILNIIGFGFIGFVIFAFVAPIVSWFISKLFGTKIVESHTTFLFLAILCICIVGMGYLGFKMKVTIKLEDKADFYAQQALATALLSLVFAVPFFIISLLLSDKALRMKTKKKGKTYLAVLIAVLSGLFWLFIANFSF